MGYLTTPPLVSLEPGGSLVNFLDDLPALPLRREDSPRWASYSGMIFRYAPELTTETVKIIEVESWCTEGMRPV